MPRSVEEIIEHPTDLAARFEDYEPTASDEVAPEAVEQLRRAAAARSDAERRLLDAVREARSAGLSWAAIGPLVGTTGEAARQRYAKRVA